MTIRESKRRRLTQSLCVCGLTDAVTARSLPVTAAYINYCFITGHILWAFISSINHSSIFISWFICAIFQTWIINKLSRGTSSVACWWMGNSVDRKPVFSTPSSGLVHRAFPILSISVWKNSPFPLHYCGMCHQWIQLHETDIMLPQILFYKTFHRLVDTCKNNIVLHDIIVTYHSWR